VLESVLKTVRGAGAKIHDLPWWGDSLESTNLGVGPYPMKNQRRAHRYVANNGTWTGDFGVIC